jgi:hypothetical protein
LIVNAGDWKEDIGCLMLAGQWVSVVGCQKTEDRGQMTEDRGQMTEDRG